MAELAPQFARAGAATPLVRYPIIDYLSYGIKSFAESKCSLSFILMPIDSSMRRAL